MTNIHTASQVEQALISAGIGPKARKTVLARLSDLRDNSLPVAMETIEEDDDEEMDDETKAALQRFKWIVEFEVAGTWIADGFILTNSRALDMLASDLEWARPDDELSAKVLMAPPLDDIAVCQGYKGASDPRFIADTI